MNMTARLLVVLVVAAAAGVGGYWYGLHSEHAEAAEGESATTRAAAAEEDKPVVTVTVQPLRRGTITETVTAYGTVVAQAGEVRAVSVPFESRIVRVPVVPGQPVGPETEVVQVEASPDTLVSLQEAKNAAEAAARDLKQVEQRFADHLATNQDLSQAQQAAASAKIKLDSLVQRGVGQSHHLKAEVAGIVNKVDVQEGQIVPAGGSLVGLTAGNRIEARLGVEPGVASSLKPGQTIRLYSVDQSKSDAIDGRVRVVEQRVDPTTRLIAALVTPPPDVHLLLDSFVAGEITRASADALIVPRDAALPDEEGKYTLYTVQDGHAKKHSVRIGLQDDHDVQVIADDLKEGDPVVVTGNYLLTDGIAVEVETPATESATEPTTTQPEAKQ